MKSSQFSFLAVAPLFCSGSNIDAVGQPSGRKMCALRINSLLKSALLVLLLFDPAFGQIPAGTSARDIPTAVQMAEDRVQKVILTAEDHFRKGKRNLEDNKRDQARDEFDRAVDSILESGLDVRASHRLQDFYLELVERIYREEVPMVRGPVLPLSGSDSITRSQNIEPPRVGFSEQRVEASPLDDLSRFVLTPDEQNSREADQSRVARLKSCDPKIIKDAQLRGFRLGMTASEIRTRLSQVRLPSTGARGFSIHFNRAEPPPAFLNGVRTIVFDFIDGRVSYIGVVYDDSIKWESLDQFTRQVSNSLSIPALWKSYSFQGHQQRIVECDQLRFAAAMFRSGKTSTPALFLVDYTEINKLLARKQVALELARKAEELKRQKRIRDEEERRKSFKP